MELKIYQIDAFANQIFKGNPAAVIPLDKWLDDSKMQNIAMENNLSETAFFVQENNKWHIRWFTPVNEVDMCGHATLASAYVLFELMNIKDDKIIFSSKSGDLIVGKNNNLYQMNFPAQDITQCQISEHLVDAFNIQPIETYKSMDYILVFQDELDVANVLPDFNKLKNIDARGVIITAKSKTYDFVCRFFAPKLGINEDPVTGSAFTQLVPYWHRQNGQTKFKAKQLSQRSGEIICTLLQNRVQIEGTAVKFLEGTIFI